MLRSVVRSTSKPAASAASQQFAVSEGIPATRTGFLDGLTRQRRRNASRRAVIEEDAHQRPGTGASRLRAANSRTAFTCSRVTGNCSTTSSTVIPSSRFSKTTATGVRVPLNTQAPLTLPGMLSTARHWDQSSEAIGLLSYRSSLGHLGRVRTQRITIPRLRAKTEHLWLDVVVREGGGHLVVGVGLGEQRPGLGLERLHGVGTSSETGRRLLEFDELHECVGELGGVATLLPIHALPGSDDLLGSLGVVVEAPVMSHTFFPLMAYSSFGSRSVDRPKRMPLV